jgi:hypothetical protein
LRFELDFFLLLGFEADLRAFAIRATKAFFLAAVMVLFPFVELLRGLEATRR